MAKTNIRGTQIADATVDLTVDVTGILPTANGGTGASSITGAGIVDTGSAQTITGQKTLTTPKIDTIYDSANGRAALSFETSTASLGNVSVKVQDSGIVEFASRNGATTLALTPADGYPVNRWAYGNANAVWDASGSSTDVGHNFTTQGAGTLQVNGFDVVTKLVQSLTYTLPAGYGKYWPDLMEIASGVGYEIGSGSVLEIG